MLMLDWGAAPVHQIIQDLWVRALQGAPQHRGATGTIPRGTLGCDLVPGSANISSTIPPRRGHEAAGASRFVLTVTSPLTRGDPKHWATTAALRKGVPQASN